MSTRTVNTTLFALVVAQWLSGFGAFLAGAPSGRWVVWAHAAGGGTIVVLLAWKGRVILASLRRHGWGWWAAPSVALLALLLVALATGLLWSTVGLPSLLGSSGLTWHTIVSIMMLPLFWTHAWKPHPHPRPRDYLHRRRFLRRAALLTGGVALWQGFEAATRGASLPGAGRRFTGSRDAGGAGADFPHTSWLADDPDVIENTVWRLEVRGLVRSPLTLAITEIDISTTCSAVIDCTGGWFAQRTWQGEEVTALLDRAGLRDGVRSIVVTGVTGYSRRFSMDEARLSLLAARVDGEALGHGHGAPLRLVVPGHRGYDWVKWVTRIDASRLPAWWNWPLPIR